MRLLELLSPIRIFTYDAIDILARWHEKVYRLLFYLRLVQRGIVLDDPYVGVSPLPTPIYLTNSPVTFSSKISFLFSTLYRIRFE